jgi:hypothetical protein
VHRSTLTEAVVKACEDFVQAKFPGASAEDVLKPFIGRKFVFSGGFKIGDSEEAPPQTQ